MFFNVSKVYNGEHEPPHKKVDQGLFRVLFGLKPLLLFFFSVPPRSFHSIRHRPTRTPLLLPALSILLLFAGFVYSTAIFDISELLFFLCVCFSMVLCLAAGSDWPDKCQNFYVLGQF